MLQGRILSADPEHRQMLNGELLQSSKVAAEEAMKQRAKLGAGVLTFVLSIGAWSLSATGVDIDGSFSALLDSQADIVLHYLDFQLLFSMFLQAL
jgi:hypothetical protein